MADVTVHTTPAAATARAGRNIVWTDAHTGYSFANTNGLHYAYRKTTDAGVTWAAAVSLDAAANGASGQDVWYHRWTPGDTGNLIHCWWFEATTDTVFWRTIDTANSDTLGTVKSAFVGVSVVAGRGSFCSGTKSRSGYLYLAFDIDAGTEHGIVRSTDSGATWSSNLASTFVEATIDECLLFPATGTGDNNDIWAIYQDASADALTMKMWDSSAAAEVESSTMQTMVENTTDNTGQRGFSGSVRHSDGHLIVVSCSEYDVSTSDMQVWDVSGVTAASSSGITAKTDITTNIDDLYYPAVFIDQDMDSIYVAYNGKSDGSDTLGTTAKVYYAKSTDGGSSWNKDNALMADAASTQLQVWSPLSGHRFGAIWHIGGGGNLTTNVTNSLCLYTLVAAQGSFTKSGQDIILKVSMPAAQASFTLTGQAVTLTYTPGGSTYTLTAAQASFTLSGQAVNLLFGHFLQSENIFYPVPLFHLLGKVITFAFSMAADFGSFTDSGQSANLLIGRKLTADFASFSDTGQSVNFYKGRTLSVAQGSFTLTGEDVILKVSIPAAQGSFTFTGQDVAFYKGRTLSVAQGSFALTGQDASFPLGRRFSVAQGSFTLTGQDASLIFTPAGAFTIAANRGTFTLSGQAALLERGRFVAVGAGLFSETGQSVSFSLGKVLAGDYGNFIVAGQSADLIFQGILGIHPLHAEFALSGQSIFFSFNYTLLKLDFDAPTRAGAQFGAASGKSGVSSGKAKSNLTVELAA